ncbi:hypothetical protein BHE74_00002181 [Ensete ventricosum]|nr:hypothetical protein BHE74_00002181 [Ensete ventricosum]
MATSSSPSAAERARFFFAATLLLVMLLAAPKPTRRFNARRPQHICDNSIKFCGKQLGYILSWDGSSTS